MNFTAARLVRVRRLLWRAGRGAILQTDSGTGAARRRSHMVPPRRPHVEPVSACTCKTLQWRGQMQIVPRSTQMRPEIGTMGAITSEAMGLSRPAQDLVVGPTAASPGRPPRGPSASHRGRLPLSPARASLIIAV